MCAARPSSTSSRRWAPTASSTTRHDDFADGTRRYDLILDIGGGASLARLRRALAPRGTVVFVGSENGGNLTGMGRPMRGALLSPFLRQRLVMLMAKERATDLETLTGLIDSGRILPSLDRSYPLDAAPDAMRRLENGQVLGKVAITVA